MTTTAKQIFSTSGRTASFIIHARIANTDTIRISGVDTGVTVEYEELPAGQSISFENYVGAVYAIAVSGTQNYDIPFVNWQAQTVDK